MSAPERRTVDVAGNPTTVVAGGSGPNLVYLHGLADIHASFVGDSWTPMLARLAERWTVTAPAHPGYNGTGGLAAMRDIEDYVFHLVDLLDALEIGQAAIVGHSLGGWLAAELALRRPERVSRLALVNPLGVWVRGAPVASFFGAVAPRGIGGFGEARGVLFADASSATALEALPDDMSVDHQLLWFGGLAGAARIGWPAPQFQNKALTRRLGRINTPTLVVSATGDRLVPSEHAHAWVSGIPGALGVSIGGAGHCAPLERPDAVAGAVLEWLAR